MGIELLCKEERVIKQLEQQYDVLVSEFDMKHYNCIKGLYIDIEQVIKNNKDILSKTHLEYAMGLLEYALELKNIVDICTPKVNGGE